MGNIIDEKFDPSVEPEEPKEEVAEDEEDDL